MCVHKRHIHECSQQHINNKQKVEGTEMFILNCLSLQYYLATQMDELLTRATTRMIFNNMLSEETRHRRVHIVQLRRHKMSSKGKSREGK